jgi:hypothetical protein
MTEILPIEDINKKIEFILNKNGKKPKKVQNKSEYEKVYFQNFTKNRTRRCEVCNADIKYNSFINHCKSKKHEALVQIILSTREQPILVEL